MKTLFALSGRWRGLAIAFVLAVLGGCAYLDAKQGEWIFNPVQGEWRGYRGAPDGTVEQWIPVGNAGEKLYAWWSPAARPDAPVLLYLHGARYDVRGSAHRMRRMHELGFAVLGIDYRGFGRSTNTLPSETLAYEDARAAWDWLAAQHPQAARYVFGHSLGGAIAVNLAHEVADEAGLIVEGSFPSIPDVVTTFKWGWLPVSPLIT